jgi:hypothetical protein
LEQDQPDSVVSNSITLRDGHSRNHARLPARDPIYLAPTFDRFDLKQTYRRKVIRGNPSSI